MTDVDLDVLERDVDAAECLGRAEAMALIAELRRLRGQVKDLETACLQSARMARSLERRIEQRAHEPKAGV